MTQRDRIKINTWNYSWLLLCAATLGLAPPWHVNKVSGWPLSDQYVDFWALFFGYEETKVPKERLFSVPAVLSRARLMWLLHGLQMLWDAEMGKAACLEQLFTAWYE